MQNTRSWQNSFDRLEASRRDERMRESEELQNRQAEAAYAKASAEEASKVAATGFLLTGDKAEQAEVLVKPKRAAKPASAKPRPRKRAAPRRTARVAKPKTAKPKATGTKEPKSLAAKPLASLPCSQPAQIAPLTAIALPCGSQVPAAEPLLITPLPRHASLAPYRKPGLFGLIGSWLRLAARRPKLPENLRQPARKTGPPCDDVAALRAENKQLRRELEALLALREAERANTPPWATNPLATPAGDAPARPRRRGGIRP